MKWEGIEKKDDNSVRIPGNWLLPYYYDALNALFRIENAIRIFVYIVLKNEFRDKWIDITIESDDLAKTSIGKIAKQRMNQAKRFAYLGYHLTCPLMYMTSGELIRLITSDSYWNLFSAYFPGSKEIISNKLDEIGSVRNALAHFRPITPEDIELVKQNALQILSRVEKCLINIFSCDNVMPTNTQENWYNEIKSLDIYYDGFSIYQSNDEKWVNISLKYQCSILCELKNYIQEYPVLNLNTPKILSSFPRLKAFMTFLAEGDTKFSVDENIITFNKQIDMLFSHQIITLDYENIKKELVSLLKKIFEDTNLLIKDNLARGELVKVIKTSGHSVKSRNDKLIWGFSTMEFNNPVQENDSPEYLGAMPLGIDNFITSTFDYPWMPVIVSVIPY